MPLCKLYPLYYLKTEERIFFKEIWYKYKVLSEDMQNTRIITLPIFYGSMLLSKFQYGNLHEFIFCLFFLTYQRLTSTNNILNMKEIDDNRKLLLLFLVGDK